MLMVSLTVPLSFLSVTGFAALAPLSFALVFPLTFTVPETTLAPAGALRRSVSLPLLTQLVDAGIPRASASPSGTVGVVGVVGAVGVVGVVGGVVGVGVGVGVGS